MLLPIGGVLEEKAEKYCAFAMEKVARLARHPDHRTSYESRDPEENKWGGAVRIGDYIFSMSGLPELADEAVMLTTASLYHYVITGNLDATRTVMNFELGHENRYWDPLKIFIGYTR